MMYSERHQCIFAHAPKCAGTAIRKALDLQFVQPPYWHCTAGEARVILGDQMFAQYYKFAVVRNPWDRIVSAWRMFLEKPWCRQEREYSLDEFLAIVVDESIPYRAAYKDETSQKEWQKTIENIRHHTLPCLHPYYGIANERGVIEMDDVVRFENLNREWSRVTERVGARVQLPILNTTTHRHYSSYFTPAGADTVARYYARDIEAFGYSF